LVADDQLKNLAVKETTNKLNVSFRENISPEWLESLPSVISVHQKEDRSWILDTHDTDKLNQQLMELALQRKLNIVSLQTESLNLEEVFRNLTAGTK